MKWSDEDKARASREWQQDRANKILSKRQRRQARFEAQLSEALNNPNSKVVVQQLPPGPKWQRKQSKRQVRAEEVGRLRNDVNRLEAQVNRLRQARSNVDFYDSPEWHQARYQALKRSNGCCELCGESKATGAIIQVDHIKPRSKFPELALDQGNLQVLCRPCNMGKSNRDSIDWRKPELKVVRGS